MFPTWILWASGAFDTSGRLSACITLAVINYVCCMQTQSVIITNCQSISPEAMVGSTWQHPTAVETHPQRREPLLLARDLWNLGRGTARCAPSAGSGEPAEGSRSHLAARRGRWALGRGLGRWAGAGIAVSGEFIKFTARRAYHL